MNGKEKRGDNMNGISQALPARQLFAGWTVADPDAAPTSVRTMEGGKPAGGRSEFDLGLEAAIAAMARQEEQGLRDLYDATVSRVLGVALRITRNRDAAEDVVAEVFHQAWRNAQRYDPGRGAALTWLLNMCRSRAIDFLRRRDQAESHPDPETLAGVADVDLDNDPEALLAAVRRDSALHAALSSLTPVQRQLIGLAFFRGLSHQEAAAHVGMPLGTVKTHVRKGLERLRSALAIERAPNRSIDQISE